MSSFTTYPALSAPYSRFYCSSAHVRQLLYIALYTPPPAVNDDEDFRPDLGSPSKLASRHHRNLVGPSPTDAEAANSLLMAFAYTNTPKALMRALPNPSRDSGLEQDDDNLDSFVARESVCIKNAKSCWEILRHDFVQRQSATYSATPRAKSKRHRRRVSEDDDHPGLADLPMDDQSTVSETAWPVLNWLMTVFEQEEAMTEATGERER